MTEQARYEYAEAVRRRYATAGKHEKGRILDEYCRITRCHRKAAIRLLRRAPRAPSGRPRTGRPCLYGPAVAQVALLLWEATGRIGAVRLHPFVPELVDRLAQCGELSPWPPRWKSCSARPAGPRWGGSWRMERHGTPAHPGSLFWLADWVGRPIVGMPTCGMFSRATTFDLVLPPILSGEPVGNTELAALGHGGLLSREMAFRFPPYRPKTPAASWTPRTRRNEKAASAPRGTPRR